MATQLRSTFAFGFAFGFAFAFAFASSIGLGVPSAPQCLIEISN
jgi:hypothetical protein